MSLKGQATADHSAMVIDMNDSQLTTLWNKSGNFWRERRE
jgi:hypothetical protein